MKIGDALISLVIALCVVFLVKGCIEEESKKKHQETALKECIEEITNQCAATIQYAVALENENANLNKMLKSCNSTTKK